VREHVWHQSGVAVLIKQRLASPDKKFLPWYRVGSDAWQSKKPEGFRLLPYIAEASDPFATGGCGPLFWCEGERDVDTVASHELDAFTFGAARCVPDGAEQYIKGRDVIIPADNDEAGQADAELKAERCRGIAASVKIVNFPDLPEHGDISDYSETHSVAELQDLIARTPEWMPNVECPPGISCDGSAPASPPEMLIDGIAPKHGLEFLAGASRSGKTFIAVDQGVALATGGECFGRAAGERVGVLFVPAEGLSGLPARIAAAKKHRGIEGDIPIAWTDTVPNIDTGLKEFCAKLDGVNRYMKAKHGVRLGMIVFDTLSAVFNISDENDNAEAARACKALRLIADHIGGLVCVIHHYGKNVDAGLRGASAWLANADMALVINCEIDQSGKVSDRRLAVIKNRDGIMGEISGFDLVSIQLVDADGVIFENKAVAPTDIMVTPANKWKGIMDLKHAIHEALDAHGFQHQVAGNGPMVKAVDLEHVRAIFKKVYLPVSDTPEGKAEATKKAFTRGLQKAKNLGLIGNGEGPEKTTLIWLIFSDGAGFLVKSQNSEGDRQDNP
jgi:hypothetical protein